MSSCIVNVGGVEVHTTVIKSASMLDTYVHELRALCAGHTKPICGLDVEWNPTSTQNVSILQLCIGTRCLIIQLCYLNVVPESLKNLLAASDVSFVGVGITQEIAKLSKGYGLVCSNAIELGPLAARVHGNPKYKEYGLANLARGIVGLNVEKPTSVTCSCWNNDPLTDAQIQYATIDAYASNLIGKKLLG
ncbi:Werner Syndrome-like exonuclease [Macadamia integrifolia]|uniref:Werner Syndrome-like exonuclease n=1 Tax=Macadamia integrifolia TaxID=60698 RepID=UPI001C4F154B|nr:Werner Syndrome-like exonuclease [Macadamia integrifolia]